MVRAWYMDSSSDDQRLPHQLEPPEPVTIDELRKIGVDHSYIDPKNYGEPLGSFRKEKGYNYSDELDLSKEKIPDYEQKVSTICSGLNGRLCLSTNFRPSDGHL